MTLSWVTNGRKCGGPLLCACGGLFGRKEIGGLSFNDVEQSDQAIKSAFCFYQDLFVYFVCNWFTYFKVLLIHVLFLPIKKIIKRMNKRIKWKKQENIICIILLWLKVVCKKNSFAKFCVWANISSFHVMFGLPSHV